MTVITHLGRLEGVLWREVQVKEEDAALVHRTGRAQDRRHPLVDVVALRTGAVLDVHHFRTSARSVSHMQEWYRHLVLYIVTQNSKFIV